MWWGSGAHPYQVLLSSWTVWAIQENFMPQIFPLGRAICLFLAYKTEVEAGYHFWAGVCRVDVPDSCSLFPKKHVLWDSGLTRWRELKPWVIGWKRVFWRPTLVLTWGERNFGHAMPLRFWSATVAQPRLVWQMPQGTSFFSLCPTYQGTVEANWEKILANRSNGREVREHWQCSEMEKWK